MTGAASSLGPRLLAFDLDGTLINSIGDIASSVNRALLDHYGADGLLPLEAVRSFVGGGARQLIERCLAALARPGADADPVLGRFLRVYSARAVETTCLYPGMREVLEEAAKHAKLAVLTNKPGDMSRQIVRGLDLDRFFISVIGGDDLGTKKPEPEGILTLATLAGADPEEVALVGDSAVDVLTARRAGALAIGVRWGYDRPGMERERPDLVARAPADILRLFKAGPVRDRSCDPEARDL